LLPAYREVYHRGAFRATRWLLQVICPSRQISRIVLDVRFARPAYDPGNLFDAKLEFAEPNQSDLGSPILFGKMSRFPANAGTQPPMFI
jgi:hypothetical protein